MSFSKIVLPNIVLTDFYQHSLVLIDKEINDIKRPDSEVETDENQEEISQSQKEIPVPKIVTQPLPIEKRNDAVSDTTQDAISAKAGKQKTPPKKWYLGDNKKNVTFVVKDTEALYLKDESLEMLTKLIGALKLNLGDVAIVNLANEVVDHRKIKYELNATIVVMFGVKSEMIDLPFKIPDYKEQQYNVCRYIQLPPFEKLLGNSEAVKLEKSKVWVELKKLFGV